MTNKYFQFDMLNRTIVGSMTNIKKASNPDTPQYEELVAMIALQPTFTLVKKSISKNENKKSYKALTFQRMEDYIKTQPNSETNLVLFEAIKRVAETKGSKYPLTKRWFLATYPEFKENNVSESEAAALTDAEAERKATEILSTIESADGAAA